MKTLAQVKEEILKEIKYLEAEFFNSQYRVLSEFGVLYERGDDAVAIMSIIASYENVIGYLKDYFSLEEKENHVCPECEENLKVIEGLRNHLKTYEKMDEFNQKRIQELEEKNKSHLNVQS